MQQGKDIVFFQDKSKEFIAQSEDQDFLRENIALLRDVIRFHENRYYVMNDPLIADVEFDLLYASLKKVEDNTPSLITPDSPTQRVGPGITKQFKTVQHLVPMLSLEMMVKNTKCLILKMV